MGQRLRMQDERSLDAGDRSWLAFYEGEGRFFAVRVVFSDETGTGSIKEEPIAVMAALLFNLDEQWDIVRREINSVCLAIPELSKLGEIKGRKLLKAVRRDSRSPAGSLLSVIVQTLAKTKVHVFYEAIDRQGFAECENHMVGRLTAIFPDLPTDAYAYLSAGCVQQVMHHMQGIAGEKVVWIADKSGHYERTMRGSVRWQMLAGLFRSLLRDPFAAQLIDNIYFGDSRDSLALQLADVCCSIILGHLRDDPVADRYYPTLAPAIASKNPVLFARRGRHL